MKKVISMINKKAYTYIELLLVSCIIAILFTMSLGVLKRQKEKQEEIQQQYIEIIEAIENEDYSSIEEMLKDMEMENYGKNE